MHDNLPELEAIPADVERRSEPSSICLGDLVVYGRSLVQNRPLGLRRRHLAGASLAVSDRRAAADGGGAVCDEMRNDP